MSGLTELTWLWCEGETEGGQSTWKQCEDREQKSLRPWAKMVQGQWEEMDMKDTEEERDQGLGECGLNTSDWQVKEEVSRGLKRWQIRYRQERNSQGTLNYAWKAFST